MSSSTGEGLETPILCEPCLGPNPYIRMTKDPQGKLCKVCTRPFTVFRWNPGAGSRFKKTEICSTCAKIKNVCQTCILDLQYGLPVQVRDAALGVKSDSGPTGSDKAKMLYADTMEKQLEGQVGSSSRAGQDLLRKAARREIEYKKDRPVSDKLCSAFARGKCERGDKCPFRHELPDHDQLSAQQQPATTAPHTNGSSSPAPPPPTLQIKPSTPTGLSAPSDPTIRSLFISHLPPSSSESSIRQFFLTLTQQLSPHHIKSITLVPSSNCAFVNFDTREHAELAAKHCASKMWLEDRQVRLMWGRGRPAKKVEKE
ncbi:RNA recognition motif containing protein [Pseudozyma hubeiensis SY62]|uniref:RNA recognition motif containing protein n=1 Tax=Pseudozyma hubeiensis (strain SY62) TaxID=1305764 RepID=R9PDH7_PSEHS|nr:RNA recognition motif containing protein [Pseudozyma hubeiensis SY62]GAC99419.1 RNA recognition motif containing protein [Pseudozyma hubeiensis SY62]